MKRYIWVVLVTLVFGSTSWGELTSNGSAGGIGRTDGQTVGRLYVPGTSLGNAGANVGARHTVMDAGGDVICGTNHSMLCGVMSNQWTIYSGSSGSSNEQCSGNDDQCGGNSGCDNDQQDPPCNTGCWPNWPNWGWPWGNVTVSSNSTAATAANGPDCNATAETSGYSSGPGATSTSHSYAQSVNP